MSLKIYGTAASRAIRPLWAAEEIGLPYEHIAWHYQGPEVREPAYLAINPNGTVPAIDDNGVRVFESLAITLYLAQRHPLAGLWSATDAGRAHILQWTLWAATEAEPLARQWFHHTGFLPPEQRIPAMADAAIDKLQTRLQVLEKHLTTREWLVEERFTVADLNVAAVLQRLTRLARVPLPHTQAWHQRCLSRPAAQRAWALRPAN
ncbi:MAG: glutathione S-transferase family protein [Hydrogenophaga sp.]|uniref:glutathione S-transferase family protein n=1 Tax=Hydrogenophaga sp. TaxID=1904254 RepID=UPI001DC68F36|nr:glutathione S-transferase family protein [Hydrogenophaga sp.]MBX3608769.1 glutathione S-transferase family protein [Hydrogenophaga sp.]